MNLIKPGKFAHDQLAHNYIVCADLQRDTFDEGNELLLRRGKHPDFIFLGDSLTAGYDVNSYFGDSSFCINRGIGGDVPMYVYRRVDADVIQLQPQYCILMSGVNEIWCLDEQFETIEDFENRYQKARGYIVDYIEKILNRCKEMNQKVIVCSILPTYGRVKHFGRDANDLIIDCNIRIQELAKEKEIIFVDYHSHFCNEKQNDLRKEFGRDGVHLTSAGYDLMTDILSSTLRSHNIKI